MNPRTPRHSVSRDSGAGPTGQPPSQKGTPEVRLQKKPDHAVRVLVWPITIVLLLPIIVVEAKYARRRLNLSGGQAFRVFGAANAASTVIGLPIATAVAGAVQDRIQIRLFGTRQSNLDQWSRGGDVSHLARGLAKVKAPSTVFSAAPRKQRPLHVNGAPVLLRIKPAAWSTHEASTQ
jgi:hypothetical protein